MAISPSVRRGAFILLEGGDRSGKSTQCERLVNSLQQHLQQPVQLLKFPDRTTAIGKSIDAYLKQATQLEDHVVHLLFSANRQRMEELLRSGTHLVVDRYAFSGVAFSAAKGMDLDWCKAPDVGLIRPDVTIYLDVPIETARQRGGFGEELYEKESIQARVREVFLGQLKDATWKIVDGTRSMDTISQEILKIALDTANIVSYEPIQMNLFQ